MSQHSRFPGSWLLIAAILAIPSMIYSIAHSVQKADDKCDTDNSTVIERKLCE